MKHYGPGGGYNLFAGKDTSLAFVTVDFTDTSLSSAQVVALADLLSQGLQACGQTGGGGSTVMVESPQRPCCRRRQPWRTGRDSRPKPMLRSNTSQPATQSGALPVEDRSGAPPRVV